VKELEEVAQKKTHWRRVVQKDVWEVKLCVDGIGLWLATKQVRSLQQENMWAEATVYAHLLHWMFL